MKSGTQKNYVNPPLLSELSESQESGNHQDKTSRYLFNSTMSVEGQKCCLPKSLSGGS